VSYIDAIEVGETVRRREHYFSFDLEAYRVWSRRRPRSGWMMMSPMTLMFALLHHVYTRIPAKV